MYTDLKREYTVIVDQLMAVRHLGPDVRKGEKFFGQLTDGLDYGPADGPSDRQQPDADLCGETGRNRVPVHVSAVFGEQESDGYERGESDQRQQPITIVLRVEIKVHKESVEKHAQRTSPATC